MVYIILGNGFEEIEALAPCDILRRAGIDVTLAGVGGTNIIGGHNINVTADIAVSDVNLDNAEMLVIPGGLGGVESMENSAETIELLKTAYLRGIELAAICAGPRVLAKAGVLAGHRATCYPGMEEEMTGGDMQRGERIVRDKRLTTACAAGAAVEFGVKLVEVLRGEAAAKAVADSIFHIS